MTCFAVTLLFSDGEYKRNAWANDEAQAIHLALVDARMASEYGSFFGQLLEKRAVPI